MKNRLFWVSKVWILPFRIETPVAGEKQYNKFFCIEWL